jgi:hypothetical protein
MAIDAGVMRVLADGELSKYVRVQDVVDDVSAGKRVYLRGYLTEPDAIMSLKVSTVLDMLRRGQLARLAIGITGVVSR